MRTNRISRWGIGPLGAAIVISASLSGCRVSDEDLRHWETTHRGPDKLAAVLTHDKYELPLRVQAALSLVRMRPREGRRIGIPLLIDTMAALDNDTCQNIVGGLVPALVEEMKKPPPVAQVGQPTPVDESMPYKDAAFALLSSDKGTLVRNPQHRQALLDALASWVVVNFETRLDNPSQMYGVEQVIKFVGAQAARGLPPLITKDSPKNPELARLIAATGDAPTKEQASKRLVEVIEFIASQAWLDQIRPTVADANAKNNLHPTDAQFKQQVNAVQDGELKKIFGALRQIGGRPVVNFCLKYASNKANEVSRRSLAVAALEGNFDQKNPDDVRAILALAAGDETPDEVRDQAFRRVGEIPRDKVIAKLYEIMGNKRWKVRRVAAQYAIRMSNTKQIDEIMSHLPSEKGGFAMTEALSYGGWMADPDWMAEEDGKSAHEGLKKYFTSGSPVERVTALSWYFKRGSKKDVEFLTTLASDRSAAPGCKDQEECAWQCFIEKSGAKDKTEKEAKEAKTIGDYVTYCILPNIKDREKDPVADKPQKAKTGVQEAKKP